MEHRHLKRDEKPEEQPKVEEVPAEPVQENKEPEDKGE